MSGERNAGAPKLRLVTTANGWATPDQPVPAGGYGVLRSIRNWLGIGRWQAQLRCRRAGHLPARTPTGTRCQRCDRQWDHL